MLLLLVGVESPLYSMQIGLKFCGVNEVLLFGTCALTNIYLIIMYT